MQRRVRARRWLDADDFVGKKLRAMQLQQYHLCVCDLFLFLFLILQLQIATVAECKTEDVRRGKMCVIYCVVFCVCARARARSSSFSSAYYELMSNVTMVIASLVTF